jgi:hypothetical protein
MSELSENLHEKKEVKVITLPNREEMLKRLLLVDADGYLVEKFYPLLLKDAGRQLVAKGVVMLFIQTLHDYTDGMPPMMWSVMFSRVPDYIDALVDDKEVATEAKAFLQEAMDNTQA